MKIPDHIKLPGLAKFLVFVLFFSGIAAITSALYSTGKIAYIRTTWNEFKILRSEKIIALNRTRQALGYGGMIHTYKNYILRGKSGLLDTANQKIGAALSGISYYETLELTPEERDALAVLRATVEKYASFLPVIHNMLRQGKLAEAIDRQIKIDDTPAMEALEKLDKINTFPAPENSTQSKALLFSQLRNLLGYNGMIHHFKNYILRKEPHYRQKTKEEISLIRDILAAYSRQKVTVEEKEAINNILQTVNAYDKNLGLAQEMIQRGATSGFLDRHVKIDDRPALGGLNILNQQISFGVSEKSREVDKMLQGLSFLAGILPLSGGIIILLLSSLSLLLLKRT